jgi:hypothetical protein
MGGDEPVESVGVWVAGAVIAQVRVSAVTDQP